MKKKDKNYIAYQEVLVDQLIGCFKIDLSNYTHEKLDSFGFKYELGNDEYPKVNFTKTNFTNDGHAIDIDLILYNKKDENDKDGDFIYDADIGAKVKSISKTVCLWHFHPEDILWGILNYETVLTNIKKELKEVKENWVINK